MKDIKKEYIVVNSKQEFSLPFAMAVLIVMFISNKSTPFECLVVEGIEEKRIEITGGVHSLISYFAASFLRGTNLITSTLAKATSFLW